MIPKKSVFLYRLKKAVLLAVLLFFGSTVLATVCYRFVNPPLTPLMLIRCFQPATAGLDKKISKEWVPIGKISPKMVQAVVASEDNLFLEHRGFDWDGIRDAVEHNRKGKNIHGGSTISQQTAKNVFLWPKRSYFRKGLEVYFTFLIETFWSKERIMEVYLNVCEMGKGIYGVEKAARTYYGKPAAELSASEAAMLASILPAPLKRNPARPSSYMYERQAKILRLMQLIGPVDFHPKARPDKKKATTRIRKK